MSDLYPAATPVTMVIVPGVTTVKTGVKPEGNVTIVGPTVTSPVAAPVPTPTVGGK